MKPLEEMTKDQLKTLVSNLEEAKSHLTKRHKKTSEVADLIRKAKQLLSD